MKKIYFLLVGIIMFAININAQTIYYVTKTGDYDSFLYQYNYVDSLCDTTMYGTWQWAVRKANDTPGSCEIRFAIAGAGPHTIFLSYELPVLINTIKVDGTTQAGYQYGQPSIIIDGQNLISTGIYCYNIVNPVIKGLRIQNFTIQGILFNQCQYGEISDNIITGISNGASLDASTGIRLINSNNIHFNGNYIGTDFSESLGMGCDDYGILIQSYSSPQPTNSGNNFIGGSGLSQGNIIADNGLYGIWIAQGANNLISRNRLFNNPVAIRLTQKANKNKQPPVITSYQNDTLFGTSAPNDIIEIFGSTGNENANEYLTTTQTDINGNWATSVNTTFNNVIATATDANNNTSMFSSSFDIRELFVKGQIFVKLKPEYAYVIQEYDTLNNSIFRSFINGFDTLAHQAAIYKVEKTFKLLAANSNRLKNIYTIYFSKNYNSDSLVAFLNSKQEVLYSEKVPVYRTYILPDDYNNYNLWHLNMINAPLAWNFTFNPQTIKIAVVDDAVFISHNDLNTNIDLANGYDVADQDPNPDPPDNTITHGTHVSGIAGGITSNSLGIASISWKANAKIIPIKSKNNIYSDPSALDAPWLGIERAIVAGADIVNMSWGTTIYSSSFQDVIDDAYDDGIILVAAAGNDGQIPSLATVNHYPAALNHVISVGASDEYDIMAPFSCHGDATNSYLDVMAPGTNIWSSIADGTYGQKDGTSMAAPIVSGLCALMLNYCPTCTPIQIENCIKSTCNSAIYANSGMTNTNNQLGAGRIDAYQAILCLQTVPPVAQFSANYNVSCIGGPINFTNESSGYLPNIGTTYNWNFGSGATPATSNLQNPPAVSYSSTGSHTVTLIVTTANGSSTFTYNINISNPTISLVSPANVQTCDGQQAYIVVEFQNSNPPYSFNYNVNGGSPSSITGITTNPYVWVVSPVSSLVTNYAITSITSAPSCSNSASINVIVTSAPCDCEPKYNNNFIFGSHYAAGITFSPSGVFNPNIFEYSIEGCASISDANGQLLFYTNGETVYNNSGNSMPNGTGLYGSQSSTQAAIILPKSRINNTYYIFTVGGNGSGTGSPLGVDGLRYHIVDMTTPSGNVILKNIDLTNNLGLIVDEKLTWVKDTDPLHDDYYWVITHSKEPNHVFFVYHVTPNNIAPPVSYTISSTNAITWNGGYLKASPNGMYLAATFYQPNGLVELYGFDPATGIISLQPIDFNNTIPEPYGLEFSPNNQYLYVSNYGLTVNNNHTIYRFSLNPVNLNTPNWTSPSDYYSALQRTPDNHILIAQGLQNYVGALLYPDNINPQLVQNFITLTASSSSFWGLPQLVPSNPLHVSVSNFVDDCSNNCTGQATVDVSGGYFPYSILWNDPSIQTSAIANNLCVGTYQVMVSDDANCQSSAQVTINESNLILSNITSNPSCNDDGNIDITVNGGITPYLYSWTGPLGFSANTEDINNLSQGTYLFTVTDAHGCTITGSAEINSILNIAFSMTPECSGQSNGTLTAITTGGLPPYTYLWNTSETSQQIINHVAGIYSVIVTDVNGCTATSQVTITVNPSPLANAGVDQIICNGQSAILTATGGGTYLWSNGANSATTTVSPLTNDTYTVTVTDANGCTATDDVNVTVDILTVNIGPDHSICLNNPSDMATFTAPAGYTYNWSNYSTIQSITVHPSSTTNYSVTITDSNGCTATDNANVIVNAPIPIVSNTGPYCAGSTIQLNSSGGTNYVWSGPGSFTSSLQNPVRPNATLAMAGVYSVTVTDANGCTAVANTTVAVSSGLPVADFSFPQYDNVESFPVSFNVINYDVNTTYSWDWFDGTTTLNSSNQTEIHPFPYPGYYNITLTAHNGCGTSTKSLIIYIIPNQGSYAPTPGCLSSFIYTDPINPDRNVTAAETWNSGNTIYIKGTLTIKAGGSLIVTNGTTVAFGPQGKVVIEPASGSFARGQLTIDNAKFTGITFTNCNGGLPVKMMWQGIEVWGTGTSSQAQQGKIIIKNNSLIEDAYNGVILGKSRLRLTLWQNHFVFAYDDHDPAYGGGIIQATANSTFNRCGVGVKFWEYNYYSAQSYVNNCNFFCKTSGTNSPLLDPYYNATSSNTGDNYTNPSIMDHNPIYHSNYHNVLGRSFTNIDIYGRRVMTLRDNVFEYSETGINGTSSQFNVIKGTGLGNSFTDHFYCILIDGTYSSYFGHTISNCTFKKYQYACEIQGDKNVFVKNNQFNASNNPFGSQSDNFLAIDIRHSTNFNIIDNQFYSNFYGIQCINSGNTASLIGYQSGGNNFSRCRLPIYTSLTNNMLNIHCNNFDNNTPADYGGKNWEIFGTLSNQGQASTTDVKAPAGNMFQQYYPPYIFNQIKANTSPSFTYFHHINPITIPTPISGSTFTPQMDNVSFINIADACAPPPSCNPSCTYQQIQNLQANVTQLKQEYINVQNNIDHGQTNVLLTAIENNVPINSLKNMLISNSPLSDTVITTFMNRPRPISPVIFEDVITPNSPVSNTVSPQLMAKLASMPPPFKNRIKQKQVVNSAYRTLTTINREITVNETKRQFLLNNIVRYYIDNDSVPQAISLLEQETTKEVKQGLVGTYIEEGDYASASAKLNTLPVNTPEDIAFRDLYAMYINLGIQQKTIWDIDSLQYLMVRNIALMCPASLAVVNAQAVLLRVAGEKFESCPDNTNARMYNNNNNEQLQMDLDNIIESIEYLGNNIPNPFRNITTIPYFIPEGSTAIMSITDIDGKLIKKYDLTEGSNKLEVSLAGYGIGMYFYTLSIDDGRIIRHKKMIFNK